MLHRPARALAALVIACGLAACQTGGLAIDDPIKLKEAAVTQAQALGGTNVAYLDIGRSREGDNGQIGIRKDDGSVATIGLTGGNAAGITDTASPGIDVNNLPYQQVIDHQKKVDEICKEGSSTLIVTIPGKVFLTGGCERTPQLQALDGKPVEKLPDLSSAASLDTALSEVRLVLGDKSSRISITFKAVTQQISVPNLAARGVKVKQAGQDCEPLMVRHKDYIQFDPSCSAVTADPNKAELDLTQLSGEKLAAALEKAKTELGAQSLDDLQSAEVKLVGGSYILSVTKADDVEMVEVPIG